MMMNNCIKFMLVEYFLKFASDKIEFSKFVIFRQKTEISPKNKCSIFIKIAYAQLHTMVNNFHSCLLHTFRNLLLPNCILKICDFRTKNRDFTQKKSSDLKFLTICTTRLSTNYACEVSLKLNKWLRRRSADKLNSQNL